MLRTRPLQALGIVVLFLVPTGVAHADDEESDPGIDTSRFVLSARGDVGYVHTHQHSFGAGGGSLALHIPIGELPLGVHVASSLITGSGHVASTSDLGLRYYLPMSGDDPGRSLQPYVRAMLALSVLRWADSDTTVDFGGGFGLGLQVWAWSSAALDFEVSYRVMGGEELRGILLGSVGVAFGM